MRLRDSRSSSAPAIPASRCPGPGGRGDRGATPAAAGLADRRLAGSGAAGSVTPAAAIAADDIGDAAAGRAVHPHPVLRLALSLLRLRRLCRGGGPGPAQPAWLVPRGTRDRAGAARGGRSRHSRRCPRRRSRSKPSTSAVAHRRCSPPEAIARLLDRIRARFGMAAGAEVTLEANPGPDERGDATAWRDAGVTRISLGAQSMDRGELRRLGRRHGPEDVARAVEAARAAGIGSVSLDLLYDVPDSTEERWAATLDAALALGPDHLSLYALTLDDPDAEGLTGAAGDHLPTTAGARRWRDRARPAQDEDRAAAQYRHAVDRLAADGWRGYEISNWARPGHESRHNLVYWERRPYEAIGPGRTPSMAPHAAGTRRGSTATWRRYRGRRGEPRLPRRRTAGERSDRCDRPSRRSADPGARGRTGASGPSTRPPLRCLERRGGVGNGNRPPANTCATMRLRASRPRAGSSRTSCCRSRLWCMHDGRTCAARPSTRPRPMR